jgi:hypothetical protein
MSGVIERRPAPGFGDFRADTSEGVEQLRALMRARPAPRLCDGCAGRSPTRFHQANDAWYCETCIEHVRIYELHQSEKG